MSGIRSCVSCSVTVKLAVVAGGTGGQAIAGLMPCFLLYTKWLACLTYTLARTVLTTYKCACILLLLVATAMPEASKEKTGVCIIYTPASWVINLPGALSSYLQPIRFMSIVYFILKLLFICHTLPCSCCPHCMCPFLAACACVTLLCNGSVCS